MDDLRHVLEGDALAAVAVDVGEDWSNLLPAVGGGAGGGVGGDGPPVTDHQPEGAVQRGIDEVPLCGIVPLPGLVELMEDRRKMSRQL